VSTQLPASALCKSHASVAVLKSLLQMQLVFVMWQMDLPNMLCLVWFEMACVVQVCRLSWDLQLEAPLMQP